VLPYRSLPGELEAARRLGALTLKALPELSMWFRRDEARERLAEVLERL
jgi:hypothetical protein